MKKTGDHLFMILCISLIFSLTGHVARSADRIVSVNASVDATKVGLLDTLKLTVTLDTENVSRLPKPELPDLEDFTVLNESTQSQASISIVNGKTTRTKTISYIYLLKPLEKGTFTIDPIAINYKGETYHTEPITVTVVEGQAKAEDPSLFIDEDIPLDMEKLKQELFILVRPETTTLFEGEQLNITYTLFSRLDIDAISLKQSPDFPGFYKEDIFNATRLEYKKEVLNDRLYNTALLKKLAVFPIKAGDYSPKPIVLEATAIVKSDDLFSFFGKPYTFNLVSNDVSISVKPLPENTTGKVFSYIVGDLTVTVTKRENTVNTGESTTCYVILKSTGNINTITDPTVELSSRGRVYLSDTITDKIEENENVYLIKKFEYTIIPEESGVLSINTKDFLYYDISSQSYTVASAEPVQINITGKDIFQEKPIIGSGKEFSGGGFNYIKGNVKSLKSVPKGPFGNPFYYLYHVILAAAVGILLIVKMKKETLEKNENLFKKKKARFTAGKILEDARKTMESRNYPKTVDLIYQALATYIAYKSEKKPQEITIKNIGSILNKSFTDEDSLRVDVFGIIEQCTMLKFSREGINNKKNVEMLFQRVTAAIDKMESYIPTEYRKIKTRIQT